MAIVAGLFLSVGFDTPTAKIGVVDIGKVIDSSDFGKSNQESLNQMKSSRQGVLEFIDANRVLTVEQATSLRDLSLKTAPTSTEKAQLDTLKAEIVASNKKWAELSGKPNLTPEERTLLDEYARRGQTMNEIAQRWNQQFTNEIRDWFGKQSQMGQEKARAALQEVAKAQGCTVVFDAGVAPYGANDLTDETLKTMNAKK